MNVRVAGLAAVALAGCAATGVTLRSNHYRVYVPAGWQVIEAGGDSGIPTLLRVPPPSGSAPTVEIRIYSWQEYGPPADPAADTLVRLAQSGVLDLGTAVADDDPSCPERMTEFIVLGRPARAIRVKAPAGRIVMTAGYAEGSLVGVVAIVAAERSSCGDTAAVDSAIKRLVGAMADGGDPTRPSY
jgi:hypothetical protein